MGATVITMALNCSRSLDLFMYMKWLAGHSWKYPLHQLLVLHVTSGAHRPQRHKIVYLFCPKILLKFEILAYVQQINGWFHSFNGSLSGTDYPNVQPAANTAECTVNMDLSCLDQMKPNGTPWTWAMWVKRQTVSCHHPTMCPKISKMNFHI